jgi:hypothetical protein
MEKLVPPLLLVLGRGLQGLKAVLTAGKDVARVKKNVDLSVPIVGGPVFRAQLRAHCVLAAQQRLDEIRAPRIPQPILDAAGQIIQGSTRVELKLLEQAMAVAGFQSGIMEDAKEVLAGTLV